MSDFLTRLAQRQLGQVASVEPRLPELFAPIAAATPMPITERALAEKSGAPRIASATADVMTSPSTRDSPAAVSGRHGETMQTVNMESPALIAPPRSAPGRSIDVSLASKSETAQLDLLLARPETRVSQEFPQRDAPSRLIDARAATPGPAPPRLERAMPPHGEVTAAYRGHAAAEPLVHVSIGRIEVTAVTAAPAHRRAAIPRKPAMSLDEYLARRQRREP